MSKGLSKVQNEVMDRLFSGEGEDAALAAVQISLSVYRRWLKSEKWQQEFQLRIEKCQRGAMLMIATFQQTAAVKLISLMNSDKVPTARQACLDVLNMNLLTSEKTENKQVDEFDKLKLSAEAAAQITKIMAQDNSKKENQDEKKD